MVREQLVAALDGGALAGGGIMDGHSWIDEAADAPAEDKQVLICGWTNRCPTVFSLGTLHINLEGNCCQPSASVLSNVRWHEDWHLMC